VKAHEVLVGENKKPNQHKKRQAAEKTGRRAETLAAALLIAKGYRILAKRFRSPAGEIDLIARKRDLVCFIEVKARASHAKALESITARQRLRIEQAASLWLQGQASQNFAVRFDVITVAHGTIPSHMKDAWRPGW
jgi:putative endonuclease